MSESLWADVDAYLLDALLSDLGGDSAYETLQVAEVHNTALWTPAKWTLPAVAFNGSEATSEYGTQHDGYPHEQAVYPYVVAAVVKASSYDSAQAHAKILTARIREALRVRFNLPGLAASTLGEAVIETRVPEWGVFVFPVENTQMWYGVTRVALDIVTEL